MAISIAASVTSPPTNVALILDDHRFEMLRDETGAWSGHGQEEFPERVALHFRATGVPNAPWTLTIEFSTAVPESKVLKTYKKEGKIPADTLLSILKDTIDLKEKKPENLS